MESHAQREEIGREMERQVCGTERDPAALRMMVNTPFRVCGTTAQRLPPPRASKAMKDWYNLRPRSFLCVAVPLNTRAEILFFSRLCYTRYMRGKGAWNILNQTRTNTPIYTRISLRPRLVRCSTPPPPLVCHLWGNPSLI